MLPYPEKQKEGHKSYSPFVKISEGAEFSHVRVISLGDICICLYISDMFAKALGMATSLRRLRFLTCTGTCTSSDDLCACVINNCILSTS